MRDSTSRGPALPSRVVRLGVAVNAALAVSQVVWFVHFTQGGELWRADFSMFYTGWSMVLKGQGPRLYDLELQRAYQARAVPERDPRIAFMLPFNYPPHAAVPACALALLPRDAAFYAWAAVQAALLAVLLKQFLEVAHGWPGEQRVLLAATLLGFPALLATFMLGQMALLALVCLTGLTLALERGRPFASGAWFVLATVKPQLAVIPAVVLVAGRRWRALGWSALLGLAWGAAATLVLGPSAWLDWLAMVQDSAAGGVELGIVPDRMYNLKCLLFGLLGPERLALVNGLSLALLAAALAFTAALWRGPWPEGDRFRLRLGLCLQLGLLTNPHLNPADALVFALPALLYCAAAPPGPVRLAVTAALPLCTLLYLVDCNVVTHWQYGVRPFTIAMVGLAVALAHAALTLPSAGRSKEREAGIKRAPPAPGIAGTAP